MSIPPPGPLAYEGQVVVPFIVRDFPPTTAFNQFSVPTIWIEPTAENAYILTGKPLGVANWLLFVNGGGNVGTLKGNTGGSVSPTVAGLINVVGDGTTITIAGTPGTNTLTASLVGGQEAIDSFQPDSGTNPVVPNAAGLVTMSGSGSITTVGGTNTLTTQLTGLTNHAVLVGAGTTTITKVGPSATTGAPLISGGAAADPGFSTTFTISDSGLIASETASLVGGVVQLGVRNTDNTNASSGARLNVTAGGSSAGDVYTLYDANVAGKNYETGLQQSTGNYLINYGANTGTALLSGTNVLKIESSGNAYIPAGTLTVGSATAIGGTELLTVTKSQSGGPSTPLQLSVRNTDATNGSSYINSVIETGTTGTACFQCHVNGGAGTQQWTWGMDANDSYKWKLANGSTIAATNGFLSITTAGAITFDGAYTFPTSDGTAGQVLTTNGAGTVTWSSSGVGTWTDTSGVFTASRNSAYFLTAASTATLPASPAQGDTVDFVCDTTGSCVITGNTGQFIRIASQLSSAAGTATNSARGDTLSLVYRAATTTWFAFDAPNGGWTTA